jgi:protein phosphatase
MPFWTRHKKKKTAPAPDDAAKTQPQTDGAKTAPLDPSTLPQVAPPAPTTQQLLVGAAQSTGVERSHNEDALFMFHGIATGELEMQDFGVFVVADGMGGHRAGEVASAVSIRTVARRLMSDAILHLLDLEPSTDQPSLLEVMRSALEEANLAVVEKVPGGGTTLTATVLVGRQLTVGHVGDTRAYLITNGEAKPITRDHSLVRRLEELGQLTPEEAEAHPQRNVLYRAIGQGANLEVDVTTQHIPPGSTLLLCSDGLWSVVSDAALFRIVSTNTSPQAACDELIKAANDAGGPDNISAILIRFPSG